MKKSLAIMAAFIIAVSGASVPAQAATEAELVASYSNKFPSVIRPLLDAVPNALALDLTGYLALDNQGQGEVALGLEQRTLVSKPAVQTALNQAVTLRAPGSQGRMPAHLSAYATGTAAQIRALLTATPNVLGLVLTGYLALSDADKTAVDQTLSSFETFADKLSLQNALSNAVNASALLTNATAAVVAYENGTSAQLAAAQTAVDALAPGANKENLQTRIDGKSIGIAAALLTTATAAVVAYETGTAAQLADAQAAVTALATGSGKTALQARIGVRTTFLAQPALLATATTAVVAYEAGTAPQLAAAQTAADALALGIDKTALQARIEVRTTFLAQPALLVTATTALLAYEAGAEAQLTAAQAAVTALAAGPDKDGLQARIAARTTALAPVIAPVVTPTQEPEILFPVSFGGPKVTRITNRTAQSNSPGVMVVRGSFMNRVVAATIGGKAMTLTRVAGNSREIALNFDAKESAGVHNLVLTTTHGTMTIRRALTVR